MTRYRSIALVLIASTTLPAVASAQSKQQCADAYVEAQVARKEGRLRDARARAEVCSKPTCPAALKKDCGPWLAQAQKDIPTLRVWVEPDPDGRDVAGARITVDGAPHEGSAEVDPGEHLIRVEAPAMKPFEQRITLNAGEGRRDVPVRLERDAAPASPATRKVPVAPIVLGALGLVGLGVFAGMGLAGNAKKADLDAASCKPNCSADDVGAIKTLYIGADVTLGVGLASIVAAGISLAVELASPSPASPTEPRASFTPARGGGAFTFRF